MTLKCCRDNKFIYGYLICQAIYDELIKEAIVLRVHDAAKISLTHYTASFIVIAREGSFHQCEDDKNGME